MRTTSRLHRSLAATALGALLASTAGATAASPPQRAAAARGKPARVAHLPAGTQRPTNEVVLSSGQGELITLPANVADVWTSNPAVADVYVSNPRQIHLFGKDTGEATLFATNAAGAVVYSANIRVSQNLTSIDRMMAAAMPEADIKVTTVGQLAVITGTVLSPQDIEEAQRLVTALLNPGVNTSEPSAVLKIGVVNRLKTATPQQVNLQVRFAEVSRSWIKNIGSNLQTRDTTQGFQFNVASGRNVGAIGPADVSTFPLLDASARYGLPAGSVRLPFNTRTGDFVLPGTGTAFDFTNLATKPERTALGLATKLAGLDILAAIDLGETMGQVSTLATPNLTALSGETGTFLAGGEIPIPIAQGLGAVTIEYKQYGVSLAYTPTVLSDGRISLRVRPEVSQLSAAGSIEFGGTRIPGLTTRRAETTVELGSGQSLVIGGLMQNSNDNQFSKTPGVGDLPIIGALFRSNGFQRNETELMIVITPYLVKPVNANEIVLPTDGYKAPTDFERVFLGKLASGKTGEGRPVPRMAVPSAPSPTLAAVSPVGNGGPTTPPASRDTPLAVAAPTLAQPAPKGKTTAAAPGFSFR
jgi:pilus assembly protein CpaC